MWRGTFWSTFTSLSYTRFLPLELTQRVAKESCEREKVDPKVRYTLGRFPPQAVEQQSSSTINRENSDSTSGLEFSFTRLIVEDMLFHWNLLQGCTHQSL